MRTVLPPYLPLVLSRSNSMKTKKQYLHPPKLHPVIHSPGRAISRRKRKWH